MRSRIAYANTEPHFFLPTNDALLPLSHPFFSPRHSTLFPSSSAIFFLFSAHLQHMQVVCCPMRAREEAHSPPAPPFPPAGPEPTMTTQKETLRHKKREENVENGSRHSPCMAPTGIIFYLDLLVSVSHKPFFFFFPPKRRHWASSAFCIKIETPAVKYVERGEGRGTFCAGWSPRALSLSPSEKAKDPSPHLPGLFWKWNIFPE